MKEIILQNIKNTSFNAINSLNSVCENGSKGGETFIINCVDLEDYNILDITKSPKYRDLFDKLKMMQNGPAIYVFEITSNHKASEIVNSIRNINIERPIPAIRKKIFEDSKILYVGKVVECFWGRLIQHLGFHKHKNSQGLQLFYWAKELKLELSITVLEFESNSKDLMPLFENALAKELKPILGKHK